MAIAPSWVVPEAWKPLTPPPEVMALGATRSPENLRAAGDAICVKVAARYQPRDGMTFCNIAASDICQILAAPLPHIVAGKERTINVTIDSLRKGLEPGWSRVPASQGLDSMLHASNLAQVGCPVIAVWPNPAGHGHIVVLMPRKPGQTTGINCTGAGRTCLEQQDISLAFGSLIRTVEFYTHS